MDDSALSLGERVDRRGAFTSRAGTGEGFLPLVSQAARVWLVLVSDQTNPSPVRLRLVRTPQPDTLSPRERAGGSRRERSRNVYENKRTPPRHQDTKEKPPMMTQPSPPAPLPLGRERGAGGGVRAA
jgi:hypothetical protein